MMVGGKGKTMKIAVISLGCAKNLVDTENLLGILQMADVELVKTYEEADAVIINTCGFIESAKTEAIDTILEAASYKEKNVKKLIVMGCLTQRYKPQLEEELPEVDCFISIKEYANIGKILSKVLGITIPNTYGKAPRVLSDKPWMAYLRIADGCDNRCSYCAIPLIRGPLVSFSEEELIAEAKRLVDSGVKELNLIAQDSSRYGYDWDNQLHLSSLLKKLDALEGIHWIRILYLYPDEIPDDLLDTIASSKHILPYFDIPVQHHSDHMLQVMHRRSNQKEIVNRTTKIREMFPDAVLRTTLLVGHPGETKEDHQVNLDFVSQIKWDHLGAFVYSKEEDTPSYEMEDLTPQEEKEQRYEEIMRAQANVLQERNASWIGKRQEVLVESYEPFTDMYVGRSVLFAPDGVDGAVRFHSEENIELGTFVEVEYTKVAGVNIIGRRV